jgi:hypothetical protein
MKLILVTQAALAPEKSLNLNQIYFPALPIIAHDLLLSVELISLRLSRISYFRAQHQSRRLPAAYCCQGMKPYAVTAARELTTFHILSFLWVGRVCLTRHSGFLLR